ncbi:MAG: helix-turn-helix domain-containing protein [Lachnospiraceae bacterium]|nr:helix-turn-helix domain-containing protein [Lachnospiraceae bacterium]
MQDTGKYYVINHLVMFTGLSDRTIRNYIASGILQGEKINGLWHFTPEQVEEFVRHPAVRPSILAKNNGLVYDFLLDTKKTGQEMCVILDTPCADKKTVAECFCYSINSGGYHNIQFSFDGVMETSRVILKAMLLKCCGL